MSEIGDQDDWRELITWSARVDSRRDEEGRRPKRENDTKFPEGRVVVEAAPGVFVAIFQTVQRRKTDRSWIAYECRVIGFGRTEAEAETLLRRETRL